MMMIAKTAGVNETELATLAHLSLHDSNQFRTQLGKFIMPRLDELEKSENDAEKKAGGALRRCYVLLEGNLKAREQAWDTFEAKQKMWLDRWEKAATAINADKIAPELLKEATHTISLIDYIIQARAPMKAIDDERAIFKESRLGR